MRKLLLLVALLVWPVFFAKADETNNQVIAPGLIDLIHADAYQVLDIYEKISGLKLDISQEVLHSGSSIAYRNEKSLTKAEAIKVLEKALEEQANIIITKTDDKHAKVTLKEKKAEKPADH